MMRLRLAACALAALAHGAAQAAGVRIPALAVAGVGALLSALGLLPSFLGSSTGGPDGKVMLLSVRK